MLIADLTTGLLLGLSSGVYCLGSCALMMAPRLASGPESGGLRQGLLGIFEYSCGRLVAYMLAGAVLFVAGPTLLANPAGLFFMGTATLALAILMLAQGLSRSFPAVSRCSRIGKTACLRRYPLLAGMLSAAQLCPPLLLCLAQVAGADAAIKAIVSTAGFFVGTLLVTLPVALTASGAKRPGIRAMAAVASLFCGLWFASVGAAKIIDALSERGVS